MNLLGDNKVQSYPFKTAVSNPVPEELLMPGLQLYPQFVLTDSFVEIADKCLKSEANWCSFM